MRHDFEKMVYPIGNRLEQKIFYELLSKIKSKENYENQELTISAKELTDLGIGKGYVYRNFIQCCEDVRKLGIYKYSESMVDQNGKIKLSQKAINVFDSYDISGTKDSSDSISVLKVTFSISAKAAPYLTSITKDIKFSQMLIEQLRELKKGTSSRLYQWLRMCHWITTYKPETIAEIQVSELRAKLDFEGSKPRWADFRRFILDSAVKEINEKSDLDVSYEKGKTGRGGKVISLIFSIKNKKGFQPSEDPRAKQLESELTTIDAVAIDDDLRCLIQAQIPKIKEKTLSAIALIKREVIIEAVLAYAGQAATKKIKYPEALFMKILSAKNQELKNGDADELKNRKKRSTIEQLTDTSWADDDWFEKLEK